jgi:hypothetical protein
VETVTRQRAGVTQDSRGDDITDWSDPSTTSYLARGVEPVSSSEDNDNRQAVITGFRVYLPVGADVQAGDRMVLRGSTYEVDGMPAEWGSPFGTGLGGVVVALKGVVG